MEEVGTHRPSSREFNLYDPILGWLHGFLKSRYPMATVSTYDVHAADLCDFMAVKDFRKYFPAYATYRIRVDLLGVVEQNNTCKLIFVEVKDTQISLINLSQLIGYCRVVLPEKAFLISPQGMSRPLLQLLQHFGRTDILLYDDQPKNIHIAKWLSARGDIDVSTIIPPFRH